jgi:hypothetical protein
MQSSPEMKTFQIINCPQISEMTISYLYETAKNTGNRKMSPGKTLTLLHFTDSISIYASSFLWISAAMQNIAELNLSDCNKIDYSVAVQDLLALQRLERLWIGPCQAPLSDPESFVSGLAQVASHLKYLVFKV